MNEEQAKEIFGDEWNDSLDFEENLRKVIYKLTLYKKLGDITGFFLQRFQKWAEGIPDDIGS